MVVVNYAGVNIPILIGKESAFGNPVAPDKSAGYMTNVNVTEKNNLERVHGLGARNAQATVAKKYEITGSLEGIYSVSRLLAYAMGTVATTGASAPYTHTISEANTLNPLTLEASFNGVSTTDTVRRRYTSCLFNTFRLTAGLDQPVKFNADFLSDTTVWTEGQNVTAASFDSNVVPPLAPQHVNLRLDGSNVVGQVDNLEFTVNNNLEYIWGLGSRLAQAQVAKVRTYDLRATVTFNATATTWAAGDTPYEIIRRLLGDTASPFTPQAGPTNLDGVLIELDNALTGASTNELYIYLNGFKIEDCNIPAPVDGVVKIDFTAIATSLGTNKIIAQDGLTQALYVDIP